MFQRHVDMGSWGIYEIPNKMDTIVCSSPYWIPETSSMIERIVHISIWIMCNMSKLPAFTRYVSFRCIREISNISASYVFYLSSISWTCQRIAYICPATNDWTCTCISVMLRLNARDIHKSSLPSLRVLRVGTRLTVHRLLQVSIYLMCVLWVDT